MLCVVTAKLRKLIKYLCNVCLLTEDYIAEINHLKICSRKHLLNGLISAATSDAITAMKDEVTKGKVDEALIDRWITSLAFIPR